MGKMVYRPYFELAGVPNVIADGHPRHSTVLTLSHWPESTTPVALRRDLSAEIALAYLDHPEYQVDAEVVSNNHFDIDGFMAVWALCHAEEALADPGLVAEVARAGDFGWTEDERAARVAFALGTLRTPATSTLGAEVFSGPEPHQVASLYRVLLEQLGDLVAAVDSREELWADQVTNMVQTEDALRDGRIAIEEHPELDLAVVVVDPSVPVAGYHYCLQHSGPCHPLPVYRRTQCSRVLYFRGEWVGLVYRFESWVNFVSRLVPARIDLTDLARHLTNLEPSGATWQYGWPSNPNPPVAWLSPENLAPTGLDRETIVSEVVTALGSSTSRAVSGPNSYSTP